MSCDGGHLGFPISIKNSNLVKDIPMIIHVQFGFSQFISFREEDLWNFSQSEHIIGLGSHIEYPTGTKNSNFVEDHPRNIPAKFGSNRPSGFGEEAWNVKSLQMTDDGCQVMAIVHLDLWSRWTKKGCTQLAATSDKVYQLLAHARWFFPGTPASSTTKTGRHDIAEILLKVALKHQKLN
jgi:hypothetical protein